MTQRVKHYRFRAECTLDAMRFFAAADLPNTGFFTLLDGPDVEVTFTDTRTHREIVAIMETVPDGHVMAQTVDFVDAYTGERW